MKVALAILSIWVAALAVLFYYVFLEDVAPLSAPGVMPTGEHADPVPWQEAKPLFELAGPFHNQMVNLREVGLDEWLGGPFSLMVTFEMDDLNYWSRLFDFSIGVEQESISAGSVQHSYDLHFTITQGDKDSRGVHVPDFFLMGRPITVLFTVSGTGHMKIWQDGELYAENPNGHVPNYVERPHLMLGGHHNFTRQDFRGRVYDVKIWNQEVMWKKDFTPDEGVLQGEEPEGPAGPWYSVEPLLEVAGPFGEDSPGDLGTSGLNEPLGGAFSLMVTALLDEVVPWARVFDFCVAPDLEHIGAGLIDEGRGIHFTINQGDNKTTVFADDFFRQGAEIVALFTVSSTGTMKLYVDGVLVGQNNSGQAPHYLKRPYMNIGNHHLHKDQGFGGILKDLKIWNAEVTWPEDVEWPDEEPEPGDDKEVAPWQDVKPIFETAGPFNGTNTGNLARMGFLHWLSGAFAVMVTVQMDDVNKWSRIFDFSVSEDFQAITAGSIKESYDLFFMVMQGEEQATVTIPDFFILEHEFTALFTVSTKGHMKVYVDGELYGENKDGQVPEHVKRPFLTVGNHFKFKEQGFQGSLRDIKIWNQEVSWSSAEAAAAGE